MAIEVDFLGPLPPEEPTHECLRKLNDRDRVFVMEYMKDWDAKRALRATGNPAPTATATRLRKSPAIREAIATLMEDRLRRLKVDTDWVLMRLLRELEADLGDLIDDDGSVLPVSEWPMIWRQGLVTGLEVKTEVDDEGRASQVTKIKLADRSKSIGLLGKHVDVQAFRDRVDVSVDISLADRLRERREKVISERNPRVIEHDE